MVQMMMSGASVAGIENRCDERDAKAALMLESVMAVAHKASACLSKQWGY